jgi:hypothetical protein
MRKSAVIVGGVVGLVAVGLVRALRRRRAEAPEIHEESLTALAGEALRRGTVARGGIGRPLEIPSEDALLRVGDPEVDPLYAAYVGDEVPGGDMTTPDQDIVDDIGRAYGVSDLDTPELQASSEILEKRDRRRRM